MVYPTINFEAVGLVGARTRKLVRTNIMCGCFGKPMCLFRWGTSTCIIYLYILFCIIVAFVYEDSIEAEYPREVNG